MYDANDRSFEPIQVEHDGARGVSLPQVHGRFLRFLLGTTAEHARRERRYLRVVQIEHDEAGMESKARRAQLAPVEDGTAPWGPFFFWELKSKLPLLSITAQFVSVSFMLFVSCQAPQ